MAKNKDLSTKDITLTQVQLRFVADGLGYVCLNLESLIKKCREAGQLDASDLLQRQFVEAADLRDTIKLELD